MFEAEAEERLPAEARVRHQRAPARNDDLRALYVCIVPRPVTCVRRLGSGSPSAIVISAMHHQWSPRFLSAAAGQSSASCARDLR